MMRIAENIAGIEERIHKACSISGRKREEITLMGVSKFVPIEKIEESFKHGIFCFGESRVKEAAEKLENFRSSHKGAVIHLIGSLQRNKAKQAASFFDCIQSVDRIELIDELEKQANPESISQRGQLSVLLEMHTGEETKSGFADMDSLFTAAEKVLKCHTLKRAGLMTMAPFTEDSDSIRASFRKLVKAQKELEKRFPSTNESGNWNCLSMGMSNDFEIAVEEGSTMLRIGSAIFKD